jgi:hypothetical protein
MTDLQQASADGRAWTPGPWHTSESLSVWKTGGGAVAQCFWVSGAISIETAEANAALIAAAPDLYEALAEAAAKFRAYEQLHAAKGTVDGAQKAAANAAIAKRCEAALAKATPDTSKGEG